MDGDEENENNENGQNIVNSGSQKSVRPEGTVLCSIHHLLLFYDYFYYSNCLFLIPINSIDIPLFFQY